MPVTTASSRTALPGQISHLMDQASFPTPPAGSLMEEQYLTSFVGTDQEINLFFSISQLIINLYSFVSLV
jgi:hypothetical protein